MLLTHPWPIAKPFIAGGVHTISRPSLDILDLSLRLPPGAIVAISRRYPGHIPAIYRDPLLTWGNFKLVGKGRWRPAMIDWRAPF